MSSRAPCPGRVGATEGSGSQPNAFLFFWGIGCPHCDQAQPSVDRLERELARRCADHDAKVRY